MNKVLIISHCFPPKVAIGAQRPYRLAKYFPSFGWEPVVLTTNLPGKPPVGIKVIEADFTDVISNFKAKMHFNPSKGIHEQLDMPKGFCHTSWKSKLIKFLEEIIAFPDRERSWIKYAVEAGSEIIKKESINIIVSTSVPVTSHLIAKKLKEIHRKPWIADFRDLWTQNPYYCKMRLIKLFEKRLEANTLANADALVTVSIPMVNQLKSLHIGKNIYCITNGYDPDELVARSVNLSKKFLITYTGNLYNGKRDPSLLFEAIKELIREGKIDKNLLEISFYTHEKRYLLHMTKKYGLDGIIRQYDYIPRDEVLKIQRESQLLLLLLWNNINEKGVYTGKIFEYLAARRPVVAIGGPGGVVKELLEETNAGRYANNIVEIKTILLDYYQEYINTGKVNNSSNNKIEKYSYINLAQAYVKIFNDVLNNKPTANLYDAPNIGNHDQRT